MKYEKTFVFEGVNVLKVYGFTVFHSTVEQEFGYRIEVGGKSIVISGDTRKSDNLQFLPQNADVLVHEALNKEILQKFLDISKQYPDDPSMKTATLTAEDGFHYELPIH